MKKLFILAPLALTLVISSCGSKDEKKDGEEKEKERTACDCLGIIADETKKLESMEDFQALEEKLNKEYPDCKSKVDEMKGKFQNADEAAKECPAVMDYMNALTELMNKSIPEIDPSDSLIDEMPEEEVAE